MSAIFDREEMLDRLGGDAELLGDIIQLFLGESPKMLQGVREASERDDLVTLQRTAHTLKGALLNISAPQAADVAARIEQAGRDGQRERTQELLQRLSDEINALEEVLAAV
ncbi:MAG: Hpt domain-containing protein [Acidobacteriota bacterium]|nr:Hpt domain-containing protein [Acidobacteriota bacterium]